MIRIFSYSHKLLRMETPGIAELPQHLSDAERVVWVDLEAPDDEEMGVLGGIFGFHVLAAEDCINGRYFPKVDVYDTYVFGVLHAVDLPELEKGFHSVEVGFFLGERFLVTHHAKQVKSIFDARGQVARNPGSPLRSADWLLHGIVDAMTDHYGAALASFETRIALVEAGEQAGGLRNELAHLRRLGRLQQDVLARFSQVGAPWIDEANRLYFQNVHAHMTRVVQVADWHRDRLDTAFSVQIARVQERQAHALNLLARTCAVFAPMALVALLFDAALGQALGLSERVGAYVGLGLMVVLGGGALGLLKWKVWR